MKRFGPQLKVGPRQYDDLRAFFIYASEILEIVRKGKKGEKRKEKPGNRDLIALKKRRRKETLKKRRRIEKPSTKESDTNNFAALRSTKTVGPTKTLEGAPSH